MTELRRRGDEGKPPGNRHEVSGSESPLALGVGQALADLVSGYLAAAHPARTTRSALRTLLEAPDPFDRDAPLHLTGSALVVHRSSSRVLLRFHERVGAWIQLGGHADPGEVHPLVVALRESFEESGLRDLAPAGGLEQIALVAVRSSEFEPAHHHLDFRYLLLTEEPERARQESPGAPLRWLPVGEAAALSGVPNLLPLLRAASRLCA